MRTARSEVKFVRRKGRTNGDFRCRDHERRAVDRQRRDLQSLLIELGRETRGYVQQHARKRALQIEARWYAANSGVARLRATQLAESAMARRDICSQQARIRFRAPDADRFGFAPQDHVIVQREFQPVRERPQRQELPGDTLRHVRAQMRTQDRRDLARRGPPFNCSGYGARAATRFLYGNAVHVHGVSCLRTEHAACAVNGEPEGFETALAHIANRPANAERAAHAADQSNDVPRLDTGVC